MTLKLPAAADEYKQADVQRLINAVRELQEQVNKPRGNLSLIDLNTGANKLARIKSGVWEIVDP